MSSRFRRIAVICLAAIPVHAAAAPRLLLIDPQVMQLPSVGVGAQSQGFGVTLQNPGSQTAAITSLSITGPNASDFSYSSTCPLSPGALPAGGSCSLLPAFSPSAAGLRSATLVIQVSGGAPQGILLSGEGLAPVKAISLSSPGLTFPEVPLGQGPPPFGVLYLFNTGTQPLNIQSVSIAGADPGDFQLSQNSCASEPVNVNSSCSLAVDFRPAAVGPRKAVLRILDDVPGNVQNVSLSGIGSPPVVRLQTYPTAYGFGPIVVGGSSNPLLVFLQNTGSEPITIADVQPAGLNAADFAITQNLCPPFPYTIAPQSECTLELSFSPLAVGTRLANLAISDNAPGSPLTIPLEGIGQAPVVDLAFAPVSVAFPPTVLAQTNSAAVNLSNSGNASAPISLEIGGANPGDFSSDGCTLAPPPYGCSFYVYFTPSAPGLRSAILSATDTASGHKVSVTLAGSGEPAASPLASYPSTFPAQPVGVSTTLNVAISNQSSSPVTVTQTWLGGAASSDYGIFWNGCRPGTVIPVYGFCSVQLLFTPSVANTRLAALSVAYSGSASPLVVALAGVGISPQGAIAFSSPDANFGSVQLGTTLPDYVSVSNTGKAPVAIGAMTMVGPAAADYSIDSSECPAAPAVLAPYSSCPLVINFSPSAPGPRIARLQLTDNASGSPQSLPAIGFGSDAAPSILVNPNVIPFNPVPLGSSTQASLYIESQGGSPVTFSNIQIVGPDAGDFTLANGCPTVLQGFQAECTVGITFTPSVTGLRNANLVISDNAAGSPQIVPLAGDAIVASASLAIFPVPLSFPQPLLPGETSSASLQVQNTGNEGVLIQSFQIGGPDPADFGIQSHDCPVPPLALAPQTLCTVYVTFAPSALGTRVASLIVKDNASGSPQSVSLVGKAVPPVKTLERNPAGVSFAPTPVGTTEYGGYVTITNTGTAPVNLAGLRLGGADAADFAISSNNCEPALNAAAWCSVSFVFTPSAAGARSAIFEILSDAGSGRLTIALTGTGQ